MTCRRPHVLHLPGHSPGEVAYYLPESSLLLSGDTLVTRNLFTGAHGAPQLTPVALNHDDWAAAVHSTNCANWAR